ncbi:MAG TPA: cbb3-type cytochrome oxidase assembly protein CcoS, partial [Steroidobacteraceae bacterium]|nr:cbb3-type cytochrome oxidase assembly protein CcoS [Steroidobacteraceae bacterium]
PRARADRGAGRSRHAPIGQGDMNALVIMIPLSLALVAGAVWAFFWAVDNDQFEDLETPGLLPLDDTNSDEPGA